MFTGIITGLGRVTAHEPIGDGQRITVACGDWSLDDIAIGDSINHSGCCLTVIEKGAGILRSDVTAHSLGLIAGLSIGALVNLEKSLTLADKLGGHLVTGHIDATGLVTQWNNLAESWLLEVEVPAHLGKFIAQKGSITVNGVSLTVNQVTNEIFEVNLIPHTLEVTTLKYIKVGGAVNLEVDLIARYVERLFTMSHRV